jgi:hypothetical protein
LPIQLPPGLNVQIIPQELQQILQQLQQNFVQQAQSIISEQIQRQSVISGVDIRAEHIVWKEIPDSVTTTPSTPQSSDNAIK